MTISNVRQVFNCKFWIICAFHIVMFFRIHFFFIIRWIWQALPNGIQRILIKSTFEHKKISSIRFYNTQKDIKIFKKNNAMGFIRRMLSFMRFWLLLCDYWNENEVLMPAATNLEGSCKWEIITTNYYVFKKCYTAFNRFHFTSFPIFVWKMGRCCNLITVYLNFSLDLYMFLYLFPFFCYWCSNGHIKW